jgi:hypothetical protein
VFIYILLLFRSSIGAILAKQFGLDFIFLYMSPCVIITVILYLCLIHESLGSIVALSDNEQLNQDNSVNIVNVENHGETAQEATAKTNSGTFVESFIRGLIPDQVPNRLGGEYSILLLMAICTLIMSAVVGNMLLRYF